tara:strand:- start:342 stop:536 length:195 start_codon:yes stop_codon:yes gene_type:complete
MNNTYIWIFSIYEYIFNDNQNSTLLVDNLNSTLLVDNESSFEYYDLFEPPFELYDDFYNEDYFI